MVMGFGSGLPLALTGATLALRLADEHVSLASIGFFALVGTAYSLKFLWAPLVDRLPIPVLTERLGRRRSWALATQAALIAAIVGLALTDPAVSLVATATWAVAVAFCSATQDIVIDAFRVELLEDAEQGAGAAATQLGYRLGMILAGAGALYLASAFDWRTAYLVMAAAVLIASMAVLLAPEPAENVDRPFGLYETVVAPFADFARHRLWLAILVFVVLYNLGDATAGHLAGPFYLALGFTKNEIASISKLFGVIASLVGVSLGGLVVYRLGIVRALLLCGIAKMLMNLMYLVQNWAGHDVTALTLTIAAENVTGGMASAAFVAYLSRLCSKAYTATQYALLSALAATARTTLSSAGGVIAEHLGWNGFFITAAALGLPALLLLPWIGREAKGLRMETAPAWI